MLSALGVTFSVVFGVVVFALLVWCFEFWVFGFLPVCVCVCYGGLGL